MKPQIVHIRNPEAKPVCGADATSMISYRHFREQAEHVRSLIICEECLERAYGEWKTSNPS